MSSRAVARTAATLKKVEPRVGTRNLQCEKRWFSTSASSAGSSTRASTMDTLSARASSCKSRLSQAECPSDPMSKPPSYVEVTGEAGQTRYFSCSIGEHCRDGQVLTVEWVNATAAPTPARKNDNSDGATQRAFAVGFLMTYLVVDIFF